MDAADLAAMRMRNQRIWRDAADESPEAPGTVLARFGAMQAQEYVPAMWAIGQRARDIAREDVAAAVADGSVLRTHVLRPTWHFAGPQDIGWLLEATAPRVHALNATYYRRFGVEGEEFARITDVLTSGLAEGPLTRRQLAAHLARHGIDAAGLRMAYILMRAELESVVISGPPAGKQQTYALFGDRVPHQAKVSRTEALSRLAGHYFDTRGPATVKDFARWSSLTIAEARAGLDQVSGCLERIDVGERVYWSPTTEARAVSSPRIDLVQAYDEVVMSYSESKDVLRLPGVEPLTDTAYLHAILLDGRLIGHWRFEVRKGLVALDTFFYRTLGGDETAAMDESVAAFAGFLGVDGTWT